MPQQSPISFPMGTKNVLIIDGNDAMQTLRAGVLRSRGVHVLASGRRRSSRRNGRKAGRASTSKITVEIVGEA
jgi:hypothetical protein